jgi:CheY-like chemotaxis protein
MSKRALIIDNSRPRRSILKRTLEKHAIAVGTADSVDAAIEYLATNRPDVVFIDHKLPSIDNLQRAAIEYSPRTATIPVMVYTSQCGELYLGQARALGALRGLAKQIEPVNVSTLIEQVRLLAGQSPPLPDREAQTDDLRQLIADLKKRARDSRADGPSMQRAAEQLRQYLSLLERPQR